MPKPRKPLERQIPTINLESGMPLVHEALSLWNTNSPKPDANASQSLSSSTATVPPESAVTSVSPFRNVCANSESTAPSNPSSLAKTGPLPTRKPGISSNRHPELKSDPDLGRSNRGITVVIL
jgi:hypothetical protein